MDTKLAFSEKMKKIMFLVSLRKCFYIAAIQIASKWVPNIVEKVNFNFLPKYFILFQMEPVTVSLPALKLWTRDIIVCIITPVVSFT